MRRALALILLVSAAALPGTARGATTLSCAHPKVLTGTEGTLSVPPYFVQQDQWTGEGAQTMYVCNAHDWTAVANQAGAPSTGVKTFPDSDRTYTDWEHCSSQPALGTFTKLHTSYAATVPAVGSWDFADDVFLNGGVCGKPTTEIMVWHRWRDVDVPAAQLHPTIAGVAYDVFHSGGYIQVRQQEQTTSGTVNMLAVFRYLERQKLVSSADTLQFVQTGFEVLTTRGRDVSFSLTGFSVTDAR